MKLDEAFFGICLITTSVLGFLTIGDVTPNSSSEVSGTFFPYLISGMLAAIGSTFFVSSFFQRARKFEFNKPELRKILSAIAVFLSGIFFCLTLTHIGLIACIVATLLIATIFEFKGWQTVAVITALTILAAVVFHYGLSMDVSLFPSYWE